MADHYAPQKSMKRYERLKAEGKCVFCGCDLPEPRKTLTCEPCRQKNNERRMTSYQREKMWVLRKGKKYE